MRPSHIIKEPPPRIYTDLSPHPADRYKRFSDAKSLKGRSEVEMRAVLGAGKRSSSSSAGNDGGGKKEERRKKRSREESSSSDEEERKVKVEVKEEKKQRKSKKVKND